MPINQTLSTIVGAGVAILAGVIVGFDHAGDLRHVFGPLRIRPCLASIGVVVAPKAPTCIRPPATLISVGPQQHM